MIYIIFHESVKAAVQFSLDSPTANCHTMAQIEIRWRIIWTEELRYENITNPS